MTDLYALRDMLDAATGPSRELDAVICEVFSLHPAGTERVMNTDGASTAWAGNAIWWEALPLTSSIDAALALVERLLPGWRVSLTNGRGENIWTSTVWLPSPISRGLPATMHYKATTAPLAILLALVEALMREWREDGCKAAPCPTCEGTGGRNGWLCPDCDGTGEEKV